MTSEIKVIPDTAAVTAGQAFADFLASPENKFREQVALMLLQSRHVLEIDFELLKARNEDLADAIQGHYYHLEPYLQDSATRYIQSILRESEQDLGENYYVSFYNLANTLKLRDLLTKQVGKLAQFDGTVTRTSSVRPELHRGDFTCLECQSRINAVEQQFLYTEPLKCINRACNNRHFWDLDMDTSQFVDWQQLRVQELSHEIPAGSMPRSMKCILRHELVEQAQPGDKLRFTGTVLVIPDVSQFSRAGYRGTQMTRDKDARNNLESQGLTGLKQLGVRELHYRLAFLVTSVRELNPHSKKADDQRKELTKHEQAVIDKIHRNENKYADLASCIAPNIFGHKEIKRGILLMLFGGIKKNTKDNAYLRGDINVCIVGDPGTSKSQFLKYVCDYAPRAVYTSGKASSAAGLTASVAKDPESGEFTIEAGALMLADNGICCIDEFDKMNPDDQVAIHEAMEQQTISITKAGVQATLNAKTSILAAANPVKGRYDRSRTLGQNVDITPPLLSRFDLFFVVLDECDPVTDIQIAKHIIGLHRNPQGFLLQRSKYTTEEFRLYVDVARHVNPQMTRAAGKALVEEYSRLRNADKGGSNQSFRITVRQLESMIRLSEAHARLDLSEHVRREHVREAARLLRTSIVRVDHKDIVFDDDDEHKYEDGDETQSDEEPEQRSARGPASARSTPPAASGGGGEAKMEDDAAAAGSTQPAAKTKTRVTLSNSEYKRITRMLVLRVRAEPKKRLTRQQCMDFYLRSQQEARKIVGAEALAQHQKLIKLVIKRLLRTEKILIDVTPVDQKDIPKNERLVSVHPNYDLEADTAAQNLDPMGTLPADEKRSESKRKKRDGPRRAPSSATSRAKAEGSRQQAREEEDEGMVINPTRLSRRSRRSSGAQQGGAEEEETGGASAGPRSRRR